MGVGLIGLGPSEIATLARVAFGGAMLYGALSVFRQMRASRKRDETDPRGLGALWDRYERGDLSWEEYEALSHNLKSE